VSDAAHHVEGLLKQVVVLARDDGLEAADRVLERRVLAEAPLQIKGVRG
jgi:hypothetical protein